MTTDAPHSLTLDGSRELAHLDRNGLIESRHAGVAVTVGGDGSVREAVGDTSALVYPRSSLKVLQAVTVLRASAALDSEQTVLAAASHTGTDRHVDTVLRLLASLGLDEDDLQCPLDWPSDPEALATARTSGTRRRATMNCSGKHASFLAACIANDWPTDTYLDPAHPLQQRIRATIEELAHEPIGHVGVDGCGAPLFALTLPALARAVGTVARSAAEDPAALTAETRLVAAVREHPWGIAGPGHPNTVVIEELGILTKMGAEGVLVAATDDGTAVAVKVLDGSARATYAVALELLARAGAIDATEARRVSELVTDRVLGGGTEVGRLRVAF